MQQAFVELLAAHPDSHIVRKRGAAVAQCVMQEALPWRDRSRRGADLDADAGFAAWDEDLKRRAINPGTTADLCVATALIDSLTSH
jgi:triphosphoribosyl-dephospho-CoA synthase